MNKKLVRSILTVGLLFSFVLAGSVSAFWPFDALFKKGGEVKAETTEKKMMVGDVGPEGSRAEMTYRTLITMNDACRKALSKEYASPVRSKITPASRDKMSDPKRGLKMTEESKEMYRLEFGIESKDEKELASIYSVLKARCENIASLTTRMQKIYKGGMSGQKPQQAVTPVTLEDNKTITPTTKKSLLNIKFREENREKFEEKQNEKGR